MSRTRIFITGASGMVGSNLAAHLAEKGFDVTGLTRRLPECPRNSGGSGATIRYCVGNLENVELLAEHMSGHEVVVHAAGSVNPYGDRKEIFATNVAGTSNALAAAIQAGAKQFVHVSSLSVITDMNDSVALAEDAPLRHCGEAYADSKVEAEKVVTTEMGKGRILVTVVRPGFIYGPGERAWMPRLIANLSRGKVLLIDGGERQTNVIYIGNLCRAIESSLLNKAAYDRVYNLTDGEYVSKKQLFYTICEHLGYQPPTRSVPRPVVRLVCEAVSAIAPALPATAQENLSRFSRAAFRLAGVNQGFDISRAEQELAYVNRVPFAEGMKNTLAYFKEQKGGN